MSNQINNDEFAKQTEAFVSWLKARGYEISPKISIHDYRTQQQGRGVIAVEDIKEGDVLFHIPRSAVLAVDTVDAKKTPQIAAFFAKTPEIKELGTWLTHILYMMVRGPRKGSNSAVGEEELEFKPYYDVLPTEFSTLMYWDSDEASKLLKGSTVLQRIGKEDAEESYNSSLKPIFEKYPEFFKDIDTSIEAFHRMGTLTMSYSFDVDKISEGSKKEQEAEEEHEDHEEAEMPNSNDEQQEEGDEEEHQMEEVEVEVDEDEDEDHTTKAMVPLADILNAHTRLCNANLFNEPEFLEMRAIKDIPKGEQVYNTYGDLPNSDLLRRYGYVETGGNAYDVAEVSIQHVLKSLREQLNAIDYSKKDKSNNDIPDGPAGDKIFEKAMETLTTWQEQGLIGEFALDFLDKKKHKEDEVEEDEESESDNNLEEFVDDSYEIQESGVPSIELQVFIAFMTLYFLDYFASNNRRLSIKSIFSHYLKTSSNSVSDVSYKQKVCKAFAHSIVRDVVTAYRSNKIFMFKESIPIWEAIFESRKKEYPENIVSSVDGASDNVEQKEQVSLSHEDMAVELLSGEIRILNRGLNWVAKFKAQEEEEVAVDGTSKNAKKTSVKDKYSNKAKSVSELIKSLSISSTLPKSADLVLSTLRKEQEAREKDVKKTETLKKKRASNDDSTNDKKKKKRR